jgi:hypothetical protein
VGEGFLVDSVQKVPQKLQIDRHSCVYFCLVLSIQNKSGISLSCSEIEPSSGLVMAVSLASTNGLLNKGTSVRHPSVVLEDDNYGRTVSSRPEMDGTLG